MEHSRIIRRVRLIVTTQGQLTVSTKLQSIIRDSVCRFLVTSSLCVQRCHGVTAAKKRLAFSRWLRQFSRCLHFSDKCLKSLKPVDVHIVSVHLQLKSNQEKKQERRSLHCIPLTNFAFHKHCGKMLCSHKNGRDLHSSVDEANPAGPVQTPLLSSFLQENALQKGSAEENRPNSLLQTVPPHIHFEL